MMIKEGKAYKYALWCISDNNGNNRKVGKYIKKQAESWLEIADGNNAEAYVDEKTYIKIYSILKLMVHPDLHCTMHDGLEDYAHFFITAILCTKLKNNENKNIRYYITALLEICRKNFKTFNSAVVFILLMLTDPKFSRFFSVAPDLKLSSELKLAIRKIIKVSPALADEKMFKVLRSEIRCLLSESDYIPLAYSEDKMDGKLANAFLADEAGAMDSYPIAAMRSSQITLYNKLGIIVSTQYPNDNNSMIDEVDKAKKVLDGLLDDKRRFSLLYEPDDCFLSNDQWQNEDLIIYQSNPVAVTNEYIFESIKDMRTMAVLYENERENYLCKHNNIKYKGLGIEGFIEITKVRECKIKEDLEFWKGKQVYIGLDLSLTDDNTSVTITAEYGGNVYCKSWGFIPKDKKELKTKKENVDYNRLIRQGVCFECGNEVIGYDFVENFILTLEETYGVEIVQIGYDRMNAISTIQKLEAAGYECVEIKQHSSVLHAPTKLLHEMILSRAFYYDENLMLEINFQNARCTEDTNLNKYVNKKKSAGKVDMVVSLINSLYLLQQDYAIRVGRVCGTGDIMGLFSKKERRSNENKNENPREDFSGELLLQQLLTANDGVITKKEALNIPSVQGCINFIAGIVSMLPIKLYSEKENKSEANEIKNDRRIKLLNDETGDTLDSVQFWRALITDYYLGKGGYAYINKRRNEVISLHYVSEENISIFNNADPIFKDYNIIVNGNTYQPFEFLKFLRNTKDGASGSSIIKDNNLILSLAYYTLIFESFLVKGGGNKKGVIKSQKKLTKEAIDSLKEGWRKLYGNSHENTVILNDGIDFQEISATALEMQLNENKESNSDEICKLFNISPDIFKQGKVSSIGYSNSFKSTFKTGVMPVLRVIENALNKDLLLEKEKGSFYYAFDTKEILKGDIEERFKAYEIGLKSNVLTIDEARFMEDLPPLNINWVNLGLNSVLYDPKTEKFYTPNTNKLSDMEELKLNENRDTE